MIDESEIMPFNFFKYGGVYTGDNIGMRYKIAREGDKPDYQLMAYVWQGPYCFAAVEDDKKTSQDFEYSEEGRTSAIAWIKEQYETRKEEWDSAPLINDAEVILKYE